ncbi:hypothetical protein NDU88_001315 [Pleurodeles waltl]|uniref:Uncharacterized protein n=1 Tax=Pleurodeles waltl TaxID=8319 RepID=A0AAV7VW38_PLEWA|nr:hypothetical protein NDU88_001315 [Pleurodeles waltl]
MSPWGITLGEITHVDSRYADDAMVCLWQLTYCMLILLNIMKTFGVVSDMRVKPDKSKLFPLGQLVAIPSDELSSVSFPWVLTEVHYLGVYLTHTALANLERNIGKVVEGVHASIRF